MENKLDRYDFSGYATRNNLLCSDGRIILKDAFKHMDGKTVPLVWQHNHSDPTNVLGHAVLENRSDGVYAYGKFNDTEYGQHAKELVRNKDITSLSIYANQLKQNNKRVIHGQIREVSLVISGANPGAYIENVSVAHSDGSYVVDEEEAIIYTGIEFGDEKIKHSEGGKKDMTKKEVKDVFETLSEEQKTAVYSIIGAILKENGISTDGKDEMEQSGIYMGGRMPRNVFENYDVEDDTLTHADVESIFADARKNGSLKESALAHLGQNYGIKDIDFLFPDHRDLNDVPDFISRPMEWVPKILAGVKNSPFSRIKTTHADITEDEARAKGYIKGKRKKEEIFKLLKRTTSPTTVYKKQKLDRDDIVDIVDFDVVRWLKAEMRMMLDEEIARAILVGDGRELLNDDKINEENIRPIYKEDELYAIRKINENNNAEAFIESVIRSKKDYKGLGSPTLFINQDLLTDLLLIKDTTGNFLYKTEAELKARLRVSDIIEIPVFENVKRTDGENQKYKLQALLVNLSDYTVGADKGGAVSLFDDFDIDYNQHKYLIETRISGALTKPHSAIVFEHKTV